MFDMICFCDSALHRVKPRGRTEPYNKVEIIFGPGRKARKRFGLESAAGAGAVQNLAEVRGRVVGAIASWSAGALFPLFLNAKN